MTEIKSSCLLKESSVTIHNSKKGNFDYYLLLTYLWIFPIEHILGVFLLKAFIGYVPRPCKTFEVLSQFWMWIKRLLGVFSQVRCKRKKWMAFKVLLRGTVFSVQPSMPYCREKSC